MLEMNQLEKKINICGWEDGACESCSWYKSDPGLSCIFREDFLQMIIWFCQLIKERIRMNYIEWGTVYRWYYGKKEVHELTLIYDFPHEKRQKFWELWRDKGKKVFKKIGFGVYKDGSNWLLFWEIKFKDKLFKLLRENDLGFWIEKLFPLNSKDGLNGEDE